MLKLYLSPSDIQDFRYLSRLDGLLLWKMILYAHFFIVLLIRFDILLTFFFFALIYFHDMVNRSITVGQHKSQNSRSTQWWIHIIMRSKRFDENGVSMVQKRRLCQSDQSDQVIFIHFFLSNDIIRSAAYWLLFLWKKYDIKKNIVKKKAFFQNFIGENLHLFLYV